jgi:lipid II:glycine glycyltransferase (peptidoglycan interpeptide bridge formation enzyme)
VWVAWRGGVALAAVIVLTHGRHSTMWRAAMDKDAARGTGATELLHRSAIAEACEQGHRFYHLGDSAPSSELARNKHGYGAANVHYAGYRFERLPLTAADRFVRGQAKRLIGFRE